MKNKKILKKIGMLLIAASFMTAFTGCEKTVGSNQVQVNVLTKRFTVLSGAGAGKSGTYQSDGSRDMDGDRTKENVYLATVTNGDATLSEQYYVFPSSKNGGAWRYVRK